MTNLTKRCVIYRGSMRGEAMTLQLIAGVVIVVAIAMAVATVCRNLRPIEYHSFEAWLLREVIPPLSFGAVFGLGILLTLWVVFSGDGVWPLEPLDFLAWGSVLLFWFILAGIAGWFVADRFRFDRPRAPTLDES